MGSLNLVYNRYPDSKPEELQRIVYKVCVELY